MPRKNKGTTTADATTETAGATAVAEMPEPTAEAADVHGAATTEASAPAAPPSSSPMTDSEGRDEPPKNWGDPYKSIFNCPEQGFELGEHRRFKQRVFRFADRPDEALLAELKDLGFTYRAPEKAWTIPATPDSRKLTDELARRLAGPNYVQGVER